MPRATFAFGAPSSHTMAVIYAWWGREEYYVDGRLLERRWSPSLSGKRHFLIGGHSVRIELFQGQGQYFTRVFVDDKLHVEELFPRTKERFERWKRVFSRMCLVTLGLLAALIALSVSGLLPR